MGWLKKAKKYVKKSAKLTFDVMSGKPLREGLKKGVNKLGDALIPDVPPMLGEGGTGQPQQVIVLSPSESEEDRILTPTLVAAVGVTLLIVVLWRRR